MTYDIIVRFPSKEVADRFVGQMCDGFGEGFCDFTPYLKSEGGPHGTAKYERIVVDGKPVCFVDEIFEM